MNRETVAFREVKRALSRFLQRAWLLLLPDILLSALSAGGGVLILRSVLILVAGIRLPLLLIIPAALTGAILCVLLCRPGWKDAARMMDAAGFQDRAVTMLDCASEDTPMAVLQRTEAMALAGQTDPRRVHRRHSRFLMILCPVLLSCALLLCAYEHTQLAAQTHVQEETELHAAMRQSILQSDLPEDIKQQLLSELDALPQAQENEQTQIELLADIDALTLEIHEQETAELLTAENLGQLMMKLPEWKSLGQAFLLLNASDAHLAMRAHESAAVEHSTLNTEYVLSLISSLERLAEGAEVLELEPAEKTMNAILGRLQDGLRGALDAEDAAMAATLGSFALESADAQIRELLNPGASGTGENNREEHTEQHDMVVTGLLNAGGGTGVAGRPLSDAQESAQSSELCYEPSLDRNIPRNYIPGRMNADGTVQRIEPSEDMPLVPYGEVLGKYYAEILEMDLPEELLEILKAYYYSL